MRMIRQPAGAWPVQMVGYLCLSQGSEGGEETAAELLGCEIAPSPLDQS